MAQDTTTPARKPWGQGSTISINLDEYIDLLKEITQAAEEDDRERSNWLRRRIVQLAAEGKLFTRPAKKEDKLPF